MRKKARICIGDSIRIELRQDAVELCITDIYGGGHILVIEPKVFQALLEWGAKTRDKLFGADLEERKKP